MQLTTIDKKWIQIFKNFAQKALIPQIQRTNGSMAEWQIFQSLICSPSITQNEIQLFVDSLPSNTNNAANPPNPPLKKQKSKGQTQLISTLNQQFHPNKTFGGEKSKTTFMEYLGNNNIGSPRESQKEEFLKLENTTRNSNSWSGLQKLLKNMNQNQIYIDSICKENYYNSPKPAFPVVNIVYSPKSSNGLYNGDINHHRSPPGNVGNGMRNQYKTINH